MKKKKIIKGMYWIIFIVGFSLFIKVGTNFGVRMYQQKNVDIQIYYRNKYPNVPKIRIDSLVTDSLNRFQDAVNNTPSLIPGY